MIENLCIACLSVTQYYKYLFSLTILAGKPLSFTSKSFWEIHGQHVLFQVKSYKDNKNVYNSVRMIRFN